MGKLIGIDLGTTNSCMAAMEGSDKIIIPNSEGGRTTPSVVAFTKDGERLVGMAARRQAAVHPDRTISSIKRDMGTDRRVTIDGRKYTPQEISAMILQKLKIDAEAYLGEQVTDAVITVPAYFTDSQRQATKDAGRIAGLNVQRIINEPTAAALAYGVDKEQDQKVMVYDLGGGTFDVSVLDISSGVIQVLATAGNNRLGGDDFDECVVQYILEAFKRENGVDLKNDMAAMQRVREAAEKAKIELSAATVTEINLPFIAQKQGTPLHLSMSLTRAKFNELTRHLVDSTLGPVQQALRDSGLSASQLGKVLLVGGSTRIPAVQEEVRRLTGKEPFRGINPDECVAMGACLQGGVLTGKVGGLLLLDVTPLSLGIETLGGVTTRLIERNTTLPVKRSQVFTTAANFQTSVDIHVLQGERQMADQNKTLGRFRLTGIKRALRGIPQIEVTFAIDANGIVNVSARDLGTGHAQEITITASSNLSREEIDRAVREAQQYAEEDARRKAEATAKNDMEQMEYRASLLMKKLDKGEKQELAEALQRVKHAKKSKDDGRLADANRELQYLLDRLELKYAAQGGNDSAGSGSADNNNEQEFYDADFSN